MSGRTCRSPSLALTGRPAPPPSTPGWAAPERASKSAPMARFATVVRMPPPFRRRTTKKEPRRSPRPGAALEERIEEIMDRVHRAGDNQVERVAALEEYLTLARAHEGETWFDAGAWSEDLAGSYLALGRVDDAVRSISDATRSGYAEGAEMLCELAEKLMRSGYEPQARLCGSRLASATPTTSGFMCRLASSTATSATGQSPGAADHRAGTGVAHR